MKRFFGQKMTTFDPAKHRIGGYWLSEKMDGVRVLWDGGITLHWPKENVPWANTDKDDRLIRRQVSTGLWTQYGNVIHAPLACLEYLPPWPCDMELVHPDGFQAVVSAVKKLMPVASEWKHIQFAGHHTFTLSQWLSDGEINQPNFKKVISWKECNAALGARPVQFTRSLRSSYRAMGEWRNEVFYPIDQIHLPQLNDEAFSLAQKLYFDILERGGEGVVLADPDMLWAPYRVKSTLKWKPENDMEGTVVGYISGRDGKLRGMMGALILRLDNGRMLELSGFTDQERALIVAEGQDAGWVYNNLETRCPDWINSPYFKKGDRVTFKYRELTNDGVPKEARYNRTRGLV